MTYYPEDMLRLVTRERQEQRVHEADAARLGREMRGKPTLRHRLTAARVFETGHRKPQPRLDGGPGAR